MIKKSITYTDFNGEEVSEDFYFHLSKAELLEMEMSHEGGMEATIRNIVAAEDGKTIITEFKKILLGAYGKRSEDGKRFVKNQNFREEFESSEAFSEIFMELLTNADAAAEFVRGVVPPDLAAEAAEMANQNPVATISSVSEVTEITQEELKELPGEEYLDMMDKIKAGEVQIVSSRK